MKRPWIFILLAVALVIYFWAPTLLMVLNVKHEPEPDPISATKKAAMARPSLDERTKTAKGNPFGDSQEKGSASSEKMEATLPQGIPVADKDLGLTLVGTVLGEDPKMNIAIIDNRSTRQQRPYQEGDRIGEVLVKRIFRNKVIIETERGEEVLVMLFEGTAGESSSAGVDLPDSSSSSSEDSFSPSFESEGGESSLTDLGPTVSSGPLYDSSPEDSSASSLTDPEPTVSSGPL
jgi:type II secretory pathway component PulC